MFKRWDKTLDLTDIWNNGDVSEADMPALGKEIAKRLRSMYSAKFFTDDEVSEHIYSLYYSLSEIVDEFDCILTEEDIATGEYSFDSVTEHFNCWMENLYNWADEGKRLCIITN